MVASGLWQQHPAPSIGRGLVCPGLLPRLGWEYLGVLSTCNVIAADKTAHGQQKPVSAHEADHNGAALQWDWGMLAEIPTRWSWLVDLVLAGGSGDCWKQMSDDSLRGRDSNRPGNACMKPS